MSGQIYQIESSGNMIHMASQNLPRDLLDRMQYQTEWDSVRHVDRRNIHSAMTVSGHFHQGPDGRRTILPGTTPRLHNVENRDYVPGYRGYDPHADSTSGFTRDTDLGLGRSPRRRRSPSYEDEHDDYYPSSSSYYRGR
jgi:hypothetical protein